MKLTPEKVFTPNDFPEHSYVARETEGLERDLQRALSTPKTVISISGPSKAGKTVLIEKLVGPDNLITVSGAEILDVSDLWDLVLDQLRAPDTVTATDGSVIGGEVSATGGGEIGVPFVAKGKASASVKGSLAENSAIALTRQRRGLSDVVTAVAGTNQVVFIDDFHYIEKSLQVAVARQVKAAAGKGVRVVLAAVPHRADDAVRSNSELRGRTAKVDVEFWVDSELEQIAVTGFRALGRNIDLKIAKRLAKEACGSPQLMQQICLQVCAEAKIESSRPAGSPVNLNDLVISDSEIRAALQKAASQTDYGALVREMHAGPKTRGMERKEFRFKDGSKGDVYRAILLALATEPPSSSINYANLNKRVEQVCLGEGPGSGSVVTSVRHATSIARQVQPGDRIVEWEDTAAGGVLTIVDPYLLFFLRSSDKLRQLGKLA